MDIDEVVVGATTVRLLKNRSIAPFTDFSRILAAGLSRFTCRSAIDFGCGSGVQSFFLLKRSAMVVVGVDKSEKVLQVAKKNAALNEIGLTSYSANLGNLSGFAPLKLNSLLTLKGLNTDLLISNPPTMPTGIGVPNWADGGSDGRRVLDIILSEGPDCIAETGNIIVVHSSLAGVNRSIGVAAERGLGHEILSEVRVPFRPWYIESLESLRGSAIAGECLWEEEGGQLFEWVYLIRFSSELKTDEKAAAISSLAVERR